MNALVDCLGDFLDVTSISILWDDAFKLGPSR